MPWRWPCRWSAQDAGQKTSPSAPRAGRPWRLPPNIASCPGGLAVCSGLPFDGVTARVVRALKEEGRTGLARSLAPALGGALQSLCKDAPVDHRAASSPVLVPVPTSAAAYRRRGYRVVDLVARRAGLTPRTLLRTVRGTADQRALGRDDRRRNVQHSMRATDASSLRVVILDDVVTTGATLEEAARALRAAGAEVLGAATIAATPLTGGGGRTHPKLTRDLPTGRG